MRVAASIALAALGCIGCASLPAEVAQANGAQALPKWRAVDAETGKVSDLAGLSALSRDFPDSGSIRLRLLNAQLQAGDWPALIDTLRWLQQRGYVFSESAREQIPELVGEQFSGAARALLLPPAEPIENSEVAWTIPAEAGLVESFVVDLESGRLAATSITSRSLWGTTPDGGWREVELDGADNLSGIVYDNLSGELWVASGNIDQSQDDTPAFSGFIGALGKSARISAPEGVALSDVHRATDGTIYASDPLNGGIYSFGTDRDQIATLVPPGIFRSPQGIASSEDGRRLYVSDYRYGIAIVDLASGAVSRLETDLPLILDGTDALFRHGNSLVAIQNGTSPLRISRFDLSEDGSRIVGHRILEQAHSDWTEPLSGHLGPDALYYVGNGQWDKYAGGVLVEGKSPDPTQIRRLPLD